MENEQDNEMRRSLTDLKLEHRRLDEEIRQLLEMSNRISSKSLG